MSEATDLEILNALGAWVESRPTQEAGANEWSMNPGRGGGRQRASTAISEGSISPALHSALLRALVIEAELPPIDMGPCRTCSGTKLVSRTSRDHDTSEEFEITGPCRACLVGGDKSASRAPEPSGRDIRDVARVIRDASEQAIGPDDLAQMSAGSPLITNWSIVGSECRPSRAALHVLADKLEEDGEQLGLHISHWLAGSPVGTGEAVEWLDRKVQPRLEVMSRISVSMGAQQRFAAICDHPRRLELEFRLRSSAYRNLTPASLVDALGLKPRETIRIDAGPTGSLSFAATAPGGVGHRICEASVDSSFLDPQPREILVNVCAQVLYEARRPELWESTWDQNSDLTRSAPSGDPI